MLVHGLPKVGKSYLGVKPAKPLLYMDVEMLGRRHRPWWACYTLKPVLALAEGQDRCRPICSSDDADRVISYLQQAGKHPFKWVTLDSIGAASHQTDFVVTGRVEIQDWNTILRKMEGDREHLRDLTQHGTKPLQSLLVICPTRYRSRGSARSWRPDQGRHRLLLRHQRLPVHHQQVGPQAQDA